MKRSWSTHWWIKIPWRIPLEDSECLVLQRWCHSSCSFPRGQCLSLHYSAHQELLIQSIHIYFLWIPVWMSWFITVDLCGLLNGQKVSLFCLFRVNHKKMNNFCGDPYFKWSNLMLKWAHLPLTHKRATYNDWKTQHLSVRYILQAKRKLPNNSICVLFCLVIYP